MGEGALRWFPNLSQTSLQIPLCCYCCCYSCWQSDCCWFGPWWCWCLWLLLIWSLFKAKMRYLHLVEHFLSVPPPSVVAVHWNRQSWSYVSEQWRHCILHKGCGGYPSRGTWSLGMFSVYRSWYCVVRSRRD